MPYAPPPDRPTLAVMLLQVLGPAFGVPVTRETVGALVERAGVDAAAGLRAFDQITAPPDDDEPTEQVDRFDVTVYPPQLTKRAEH